MLLCSISPVKGQYSFFKKEFDKINGWFEKAWSTAMLKRGVEKSPEQIWNWRLHSIVILYIVIQCLSRVNKFSDWYMLRLNSAASCIWDAHISAHCISRWSEIHHSFPSLSGLLPADKPPSTTTWRPVRKSCVAPIKTYK